VGASVRRTEDDRLLRGAGRYTDDFILPGMLSMAVVRSPHAHARVVGIDVAPARRLAGVVAVLTRADLPECAGSVPPLVPAPDFHPYHHPVLAAERVMHLGEGVAVVVAESAYIAADAVERVAVAYEPLPVAASPASALAPHAPRVHDGWPDNLAGTSESGTGDTKTAFAKADVIEEMHLDYPRVAGMPIEGRGVLASYEGATGLLTVWLSTQVPFAVRSGIATVLGMAEEHVRVIAPEVGGGFGVKGHVYPEDILVPAVARRLGRPVKWIETRREHFLTAAADRDQVHHARLGVSREGAIVALETEFTRDHGAHTTLGEAITYNTINHLVGPYRVPHYRGVGRNVVTHKTFLAAYRGAGRPEANFVLDRLLDRAARAVGMDPAAFRRQNLVRFE
jgi:carbon-monoxide dehydrogenase large subunit